MAYQRIRLKNTNVPGKVPSADQLDTAELCIQLKDKKLFSKDVDGNVFAVAGGNAIEEVNLDYIAAADKGTVTNDAGEDADLPLATSSEAGLMSPAAFDVLDGVTEIGDGTITITKADGTPIGSFTTNQAGDDTIALPASVVPSAPGDGKLTIKDADGAVLGEFTADQATGVDTVVDLPAAFSGDYNDLTNLPDIGDGTITIKQGGAEKGVFTVNQAGDLEIDLDAGGDGTGFVLLDDGGTEQSIIGGGGLDVVGGITSEFGTDAAQLGNVAPMNDWSCYPKRPTTFAAPAPQPEAPVNPIAPTPTPTPAPTEEVDPGFGVDGGFTSSNIVLPEGE